MSIKLERIAADIEKARRKRDEWDVRLKELEEKYREQENTEIHDMVHAMKLSPGELAEILKQASKDGFIKPAKASESTAYNYTDEEREVKEDEE